MNTVLKQVKPRISPTQIAKIQQYRELKAEIEKLERVKKMLKESILDVMANDTEVYDYEGNIIAKKIDKTRTSIDTSKLKTINENIYNSCLRTTQYAELRVS